MTCATFKRFLFSSTAVAMLLPTFLQAGHDATFSADVKVVNLLASVSDKDGHIINGLTPNDFVLEEDGKPQAIRYFAQQSDLPLTVGLLVDTSGSVVRVVDEERHAAHNFIKEALRAGQDKAFLMHFDTDVNVLQETTSSRKDLDAKLDSISSPVLKMKFKHDMDVARQQQAEGQAPRVAGTALYDAIYSAAQGFMQGQPGRKALIVLTDGVDSGSSMTLRNAVQAAQKADTIVYSIHIVSDLPRKSSMNLGTFFQLKQDFAYGQKVLEAISQNTGGKCFEVSKGQSVEQVFERIQHELRNQYSLGYTPSTENETVGFHKIRLVAKQDGLQVQTRAGYYAKQQNVQTASR